MSAEDFHKKYASVMESMLKSAVAETTKLFESMVNELKTEISQMRKENEDLKTRCIQIATAEGHSRHSLVDGEASRKRDTAVQCDFGSDNTDGVEQCQQLECLDLQSAEYPSEQINYNLQEHNYVVPSNTTLKTLTDVKQEESCDSPVQSYLKQEDFELAVISGEKHCDAGSKETLIYEAEHRASTTVQTQTKNKLDVLEAHNQPYNLQNSIVISLKDVFRGDIKEETENEGEIMERETGEQLSTSEKPHIVLQESHQTNEIPIKKSAVVLLKQHDKQNYTKGESAHSTKSVVNKEVEEKGPEDCVAQTSCKPVLTVRGKRGRPPKKRKQKKKAESISSKVLPVQSSVEELLVEEKETKGLTLVSTEDGVTSQSSEILQTELQPPQDDSNTLVKSNKNTEVCSLPVSVECKGNGPASKKHNVAESKKASVQVKERTPIIGGISSTLETSNTPLTESLPMTSLAHKECDTAVSLQDAILLVEAMNQSTVESIVSQSQNLAQSQNPCSGVKCTVNTVSQMGPKISLQPVKTAMTADASTIESAKTTSGSIIPKIIIVPKRNQTSACDGVPAVTVLSEKPLTQTHATSQTPIQPLTSVQQNRKTRIILVPRINRESASRSTTGVCPLKLSSFTMTEKQNNLPQNSTYVDLPLLPPSTSQVKKNIKVCYKQIFPDVHLLTKTVSNHQHLETSQQKKIAVESQAAPDKLKSLENPELVVQSKSSKITESVGQCETLDMPESMEMSESGVQSDTLISLESPESLAQSKSLEMTKSLEKSQQLEKQEFVDKPELSEKLQSMVFKEKQNTEGTTTVPIALSMQFSTKSQKAKLSCTDKRTVVEQVDTTDSSDSSKQTISPSKVANISTETCSRLEKSAELPGSVATTLSVPTKQNLLPVVRLARLPFFVSTKETVLVSRLSPNRYVMDRMGKVGQGIGKKNSGISISTATQKAHNLNKSKVSFKTSTTREAPITIDVEQADPFSLSKKGSVKLSVACNRIDSSQKPDMMRKLPSKRQACHLQPTSIASKEAVASDLQATDAIFLTPLSMSPATDPGESRTSNADGAIKSRSGMEKSLQKCTIFARLQNHLKAHMESKTATKAPSSDSKTTSNNSKKLRLENESVCYETTSSGLDCSSKPDVFKSIACPEKKTDCQFSVDSRSVMIKDAECEPGLCHHRSGPTSDCSTGIFRSNLDKNSTVSNNVKYKPDGRRMAESTKAKSTQKPLESVSLTTRHSVLGGDGPSSEFGKSKSLVSMGNEPNPKTVKKASTIQNTRLQSPRKSAGEQINSPNKSSLTCDKKFIVNESFSTFNSFNQGSHSGKLTTEESAINLNKSRMKYKTTSKVLNGKEAKVKNKAKYNPTRQLTDGQNGSTVVKKCIGKVWYPPTLPPNEKPSTEIKKPPRKNVQDQIPFEPFNKAPIVSPLQPLAVIGKFLLRNQCGVCGRVFGSSAALESHVSLHKLNQPFSCSLCGKSFSDSASLKRHGRVHRNGRIHVCHQCGKGFVYKFGLSKHLEMVHEKIKRYICQTCNKKFFTKRDVEIHIRIHTGETPFHCHLCERQFTSQVKLNVHLRWHNGEKRHWCSYCDKGFLDYNNLKRHKYIHTGERPCSCPYCPKRFTQIGHVRKHVRNVHKKIF